MSMGKKRQSQQEEMWIDTRCLPKAPGHPFYLRLNEILRQRGFDDFVEGLSAPHYAERLGRPSLPPGVYFRLLMLGYFEGVDSERGIAWRVADSLTLRAFLGYEITEPTPDHSTLAKTRVRASRRTAPGGVQLDADPVGQGGSAEGENGRRGCHEPGS